MTEITIRRPSDMHQHVRDGWAMNTYVRLAFERFQTALIMPNLKPPITTYAQMAAYRASILSIDVPPYANPIMTFYLTDGLDSREVETAAKKDPNMFAGIKYYPRGLTTNSDSGVEIPSHLWTPGSAPYAALRELAHSKKVLLLHAADGFDASGKELDPFDQEPHFIRETLPRIIDAHPDLKISVEHMSTSVGADFMIRNGSTERLGCSLTAHHLLMDRRDMLRGGMRPGRFWWPIIQREDHKLALYELVRQRLPWVWLGSDSAPHPNASKFNACCSGGVLMSHAGIELYAEAFDTIGALDYLEQFASINGPTFYGQPVPEETITLIDQPWTVRPLFAYGFIKDGDEDIQPFRLHEKILWSMKTDDPSSTFAQANRGTLPDLELDAAL